MLSLLFCTKASWHCRKIACFSLLKNDVTDTFISLQSHIRVLESSQENISALLIGLEYLINISFVDDTEVFKVVIFLLSLSSSFSMYV